MNKFNLRIQEIHVQVHIRIYENNDLILILDWHWVKHGMDWNGMD